MKQFDLLRKDLRELSFDSDGLYTVYGSNYSYYNCWEITEDEIKTLESNVKKLNTSSIKDNDVIYFDKDASFPKLMLNRLNLNIKRTIKLDKCTKIIVNPSSIISPSELNSRISGYIIFVGRTDETDFNQVMFINDTNVKISEENGITLDLMQKYFPGIWKKVTLFPPKITQELVDLTNSCSNKICTVQQIAAYLNLNLSKLDDESAKTIISLFKSGHEEKKLAINMVASFNISDILFDIADAIGHGTGDFDTSTKNSITYKYFKLLLGCSPSEIIRVWERGWNCTKLSAGIFNSSVISLDQKKKAWHKFCQSVTGYDNPSILSYWQRCIFDDYDIPYSYDPERKTNTSNTEVEESRV